MRSASNPAYADSAGCAGRHLQDGSARTATRAEVATKRMCTSRSTDGYRCTLLRIRLGLCRLIVRSVAGRRHIHAAVIHPHAGGFGRPGAVDRVSLIGHSGCCCTVSIPGTTVVSRKRCPRHAHRHDSHARHDDGQNCLVHFDSPGKRCRIASRYLIYGPIPALDACRPQRRRCAAPFIASPRRAVTSRYQSRIRVSPVNENRP